jgi:hypothetical protein
MRFKGGFNSTSATTPLQSLWPVQPGTWTLQQQGQAVQANTWPYAGATAGFMTGITNAGSGVYNFNVSFTDKNGFTYVGGQAQVGGGGTVYGCIMKFDQNGQNVWTLRIGDGNVGLPNNILVDSLGNVYAFCGNGPSISLFKYSASGTYISSLIYSSSSSYYLKWQTCYIDSADNLYATINWTVSGSYLTKFAVVKFDTSLGITWKSVLNSSFSSGNGNSIFQGLSVDSSGNVYVVGTDADSSSNRYALLYKLNSSGVFQSAIRFNNLSQGRTLAIDNSDNIYIGGYDLTVSLGFVAMYNTSLVQQWSKDFGLGGSVSNFIKNPQTTNSIIGLSTLISANSTTNYVDSGYVFSIDSTGSVVWSNILSSKNTNNNSYDTFYYDGNRAPNNIGLSSSNTVFPFIATANPGQTYQMWVGTLPFNGKNSAFINASAFGSTWPFVYGSLSLTSSTLAEASTSVTLSVTASQTLTSTTTTTGGSFITPAGGLRGYSTANWTNSADKYGSLIFSSPGTYTWIAPSTVTSVSVLAVGPGGGNKTNYASGSGGGLGYKNNYSITPGNSYTIIVGTQCVSNSSFVNASTLLAARGRTSGSTSTPGGVYVGDGGGQGGSVSTPTAPTYGGGGGAGGYAGSGGAGNRCCGTSGSGGGGGGGNAAYKSPFYPGQGGGGVGIYGQGTSGNSGAIGPTTEGGSGGTSGGTGYQVYCGCSGSYSGYTGRGGTFGGGTGGVYCQAGVTSFTKGWGGQGVVRIVYPGNIRSFPSTKVCSS